MFFKILNTIKFFIIGIILIGASFIIITCKSNPNKVNNRDELEIAIREVSDYLNSKIKPNSKVVFLNIQSNYPDFSEYIISILSENAVNDNVFSVVERQQLDIIRNELNFQLSGEVSDKSAQSIGQMLGAQIIVSGTLAKIGALYRLQIKAIEVQSAAIQGQFSRNIPENMTIVALTKNQLSGISKNSSSDRNTTSNSTKSSTPASTSTVNIHWTIGSYTNEWGDKTGGYFTQYDGTIDALFSNSAWNNTGASITELTFSKSEGLSFRIPMTTGWTPISDSDINIVIRSINGNEEQYKGRFVFPRSGRRNIFIPYNEDLLNSLLKENIIIRLSAGTTIRYQFNYPPYFQQAYERLINKENSKN